MRRLLLPVGIALLVAGCSPAREPAPDFNGTWGHQRVFGIDQVCPERLPDGSVRNVECPPPPGAAPAEQAPDFPKYRPELVAKVEELSRRQVELDTVLRCFPPGVPRIGPPAKIVQTTREVVFLYDDPNGSFFRVIPIDGRPRPSNVGTAYLGDGWGRFDGDTLVVETGNLGDETWLTDNGAFHTARLKVTERLRRVGETIEYQAIAEDPDVLVEPWRMKPRTLQRSTRGLDEPLRCEERDLPEMVDRSQFHENPR